MHELSIAAAVVDAVSEAAAGERVTEVRIRVGELSGVVPGALAFAFEVAAAGSCCEGAELVIDHVPVTVWCAACTTERALTPPLRFRCPTCGEPTADVRGGRELTISSYTLAAPAEV